MARLTTTSGLLWKMAFIFTLTKAVTSKGSEIWLETCNLTQLETCSGDNRDQLQQQCCHPPLLLHCQTQGENVVVYGCFRNDTCPPGHSARLKDFVNGTKWATMIECVQCDASQWFQDIATPTVHFVYDHCLKPKQTCTEVDRAPCSKGGTTKDDGCQCNRNNGYRLDPFLMNILECTRCFNRNTVCYCTRESYKSTSNEIEKVTQGQGVTETSLPNLTRTFNWNESDSSKPQWVGTVLSVAVLVCIAIVSFALYLKKYCF